MSLRRLSLLPAMVGDHRLYGVVDMDKWSPVGGRGGIDMIRHTGEWVSS